jgi:hypothetical protein
MAAVEGRRKPSDGDEPAMDPANINANHCTAMTVNEAVGDVTRPFVPLEEPLIVNGGGAGGQVSPPSRHKQKRSRIDRFNIDLPWSPHLYYYSVRGAENFHIYLWILKDWGT